QFLGAFSRLSLTLGEESETVLECDVAGGGPAERDAAGGARAGRGARRRGGRRPGGARRGRGDRAGAGARSRGAAPLSREPLIDMALVPGDLAGRIPDRTVRFRLGAED